MFVGVFELGLWWFIGREGERKSGCGERECVVNADGKRRDGTVFDDLQVMYFLLKYV
jgi:hypothetical protein